jgi:hypothetical protein
VIFPSALRWPFTISSVKVCVREPLGAFAGAAIVMVSASVADGCTLK